MKKIGFVDYYLSEWHANNYPAWIAEACAEAGADYRIGYAWAELDVSPKDGLTSDDWCQKFGAERCETLSELCEKSDVIVILAPSDPEKHLGYAEEVLKHGKRTYIDKTFAPDLATAKQIFALGERYGTPFFSSSALRYAEELGACPDCRQMITMGSGSNLPEYVIHQVEMIVKKLGVGAKRIRAEQLGGQTYLHIGYDDDRTATMIFARSLPFVVYMSDGKAEGERPTYVPVTSAFFKGLIADMVRFFEEGTVSFDGGETLEVMKIREGALRATETPYTWVTLG